jgi:hypothetical protein
LTKLRDKIRGCARYGDGGAMKSGPTAAPENQLIYALRMWMPGNASIWISLSMRCGLRIGD